jgi:hypothetical protein
MKSLAFLLAIAVFRVPASLRAQDAAADPIVGKWRWHTEKTHVFKPDGTVDDGKWKCLSPDESPRRYVIKWSKSTETLELINDNNKLEGKTKKGKRVWGQRIVEATAAVKPSEVEVLATIGTKTTSAVLAPLTVSFRDIRPDLIALRDNLRDEAAQQPAASAATYQLANRLCEAWLSALAERDTRRREFGAKAPAVKGMEHSKKTTLHFWDDLLTFDRELVDAKEKRDGDAQKDAFFSDAQKTSWNNRAAALRPGLENLYAQFREARRQSAVAPAQ